jgi:hypothetical protein
MLTNLGRERKSGSQFVVFEKRLRFLLYSATLKLLWQLQVFAETKQNL